MSWNDFFMQLLTAFVTIVVAFIPIAVPIVLNRLFDKWGAVADTERRKAVIAAVVNGLVGALSQRGFKQGDVVPHAVQEQVLHEATTYTQKTVPDTLKKLGVPLENLPSLAKTHLPQVLGTFGPLGTVIGTIGAAVIDAADGPNNSPRR
jgi:hypothetical protein